MPWAEVGGRQGQSEGSIPGLLLPPHCIEPQSQAQAPSWRPGELPTLFPDLLANAPPGGSSRLPPPILIACLYSSTTWSPLASSHSSSTSASLTDHLCGVLGRRRRGGKGEGNGGEGRLERGHCKGEWRKKTQGFGPVWWPGGMSTGALCCPSNPGQVTLRRDFYLTLRQIWGPLKLGDQTKPTRQGLHKPEIQIPVGWDQQPLQGHEAKVWPTALCNSIKWGLFWQNVPCE